MTKVWGKHFWVFIHSLAECMSEECYNKNSELICTIYRQICLNLPCSECTRHATQYIKGKINPTVLNTHHKFKLFFYTFHNDVNRRLKKPQFYEFQMYEKAKLHPIYKNFEYYFLKNYTPNSGFDIMLRKKEIIKKLRSFLSDNVSHIKWN
jgi:hypothetical protein